jgi:hypothetical protein
VNSQLEEHANLRAACDVSVASKLNLRALLIAVFGLCLHPVIIGLIIFDFGNMILSFQRSNYPLPVFLTIYTVLVASWIVLAGALIPSAAWYLPAAMKIKTSGDLLTIKARSDVFTTQRMLIKKFSVEHAIRWDARGWGGSQLLVWRGHALVISVIQRSDVVRLAFPLFNLPDTNQELLTQLNKWLDAK